jgi:hypothetical protein
MKRIPVAVSVFALLIGKSLIAADGLTIHVTTKDLTTGKTIKANQTIAQGHTIQVSVTTNSVDCAGQFAVSALGAPGNPPAVLVQVVPYIIGPFVGSNIATGVPITVASLSATESNDFKVSATCNGAPATQWASSHLEFFVAP